MCECSHTNSVSYNELRLLRLLGGKTWVSRDLYMYTVCVCTPNIVVTFVWEIKVICCLLIKSHLTPLRLWPAHLNSLFSSEKEPNFYKILQVRQNKTMSDKRRSEEPWGRDGSLLRQAGRRQAWGRAGLHRLGQGGPHRLPEEETRYQSASPLTSYFKGNILGITKFCNFSFEPIGSSCDGQEERHKISIGFLNAKSQPQTVNWILILGVRTAQSESVGSEIKVRTTFITDLQTFLSSSSYKRAKFLLNIPELVYHEERVLGKIKKLFLVLENIEITKKCKPSPPYLVQVRML